MNTLLKRLKFLFKGLPLSALSTFKLGKSNQETEFYTRWIFACVDLISNAIAQSQWRLYQTDKKGEVTEIFDHKILSLLYKFNDRMTKFDSMKLSVIYFLLQGKTPWVFTKDAKGLPDSIFVVPPTSLRVTKKSDGGFPIEYSYNGKTVSADNVLLIKNPDPNNPLDGRSYIEAIRTTAETDAYMVAWNKNLMLKGAKPSMAIEVQGTLNVEEQKVLKAMLEEQYGGYENAESVLVLANGSKMVPTSIPPKDLEWIQGRNLNRDEILAIFRVPKIFLGMEGGLNRATSETAERVFAQYMLDPLMTMFVEQLNEFFVPLFGDNLWVDVDSFAPEDKELMLSEFEKGWNKWLTTNEIRRSIGKPDLQGGDAIYQPLVNVPTMTEAKVMRLKAPTAAYVPLKKQKEILRRVSSRTARRSTGGEDIARRVEQKLLEKKDAKVLKIKEAKAELVLTEDKKAELWKQYVELKDLISKTWQDKFMQIFSRQADIVIDKLKAKKSIKAKSSVEKYLFDEEEEVKATISIITPQYYATLVTGAQTGADLINQPKINIADIPAVQKWVGKIAEKYATEITATTKQAFINTLSEGIEEGESVGKLSERVQNYIEDIASTRADMIARTESARALTAGEAFAWEEYDIKDVEWYLAGGDPCPICVSNSLDDWDVKDAQKGISEYSHPNCECTFLPK